MYRFFWYRNLLDFMAKLDNIRWKLRPNLGVSTVVGKRHNVMVPYARTCRPLASSEKYERIERLSSSFRRNPLNLIMAAKRKCGETLLFCPL